MWMCPSFDLVVGDTHARHFGVETLLFEMPNDRERIVARVTLAPQFR